MALLARERDGIGQAIDVSMLTANAYMMSDDWCRWPGAPDRPRVDADLLGTGPLDRLYPASEGWVFACTPTTAEFRVLCDVLRLDGLADDPRFATPADRLGGRLRRPATWPPRLAAAIAGADGRRPRGRRGRRRRRARAGRPVHLRGAAAARDRRRPHPPRLLHPQPPARRPLAGGGRRRDGRAGRGRRPGRRLLAGRPHPRRPGRAGLRAGGGRGPARPGGRRRAVARPAPRRCSAPRTPGPRACGPGSSGSAARAAGWPAARSRAGSPRRCGPAGPRCWPASRAPPGPASPAELAAASDVVSVCVVDDAGVDAVLGGPEGVLAGLRPGAVVAVHATVHPTAAGAGRTRWRRRAGRCSTPR